MINKLNKMYRYAFSFALLACLATQTVSAASETTRRVDCNRAKASIQDELDKVKAGNATTIEISGNCIETVNVTTNDLTLLAGEGGGTITGSVNVISAQRVTIDGLTITGPGDGVIALDGAAVTIKDATLTGNAGSGVLATRNAVINLHGNTMGGNGEYGVLVVDGANANVQAGNTIESSVGDFFVGAAIGGFRHATIRIRGGGNTIRNTVTAPPGDPRSSRSAPGFAIDVEHVSIFRQDQGGATITGHISIFNLTSADFREMTLSGHVFIDGLDSNFRARNSTITGGMNMAGVADIRSNVIFNGDIFCNFRFLNPNFTHNGERIDCFPELAPPP